jgi:DNA-binding GntR family transcriptional regulator
MLMETSKNSGAQRKREPLTARFTRVLRSAIMNGEFGLGERLVEMTLAERYNVSRQVVRVALQALEGEGLVVSDAFCGRSVTDLGAKEFEAVFLIRISLECTAAALAAYKITQEQGRQLIESARLLRERPQDFSQLVEWDAAIHRAIWQIADEPLLTAHLEKLIWPFIVSGSRVEIAHSDQESLLLSQIEREQSNHPGGHGPLLQAICHQEPAAARDAVVRHMLSTGTLDYSRETANAFAATFSISNLSSA